MAEAEVVSLADRLKLRREELGLSQAQAARELDVARTAYRLWELEAAKPAPDRWRLISRWLGVSVATMLLAEELVTEEEATLSELAAVDFGRRSGRDWDEVGAEKPGDFFAQARELVADGSQAGDITTEQADALAFLITRIEQERAVVQSKAWEAAELRKSFAADAQAPGAAREALSFVGGDLPEEVVQTASLLTSELVTNSVQHGPQGESATVGLFVDVTRNRLRVEVADGSRTGARPRAAGADGGFGLALVAELASRWGAGRDGELNVTWFELDLPLPGAHLAHRPDA